MSSKKKVFFMEIFNEILKLNDTEIMIVYDDDGDIWFGLRDIVKALKYNNYRKAVARLKINKKYIKLYLKIHGTP